MYMLYVCLLAPLLQNSFALIGEETDLSSLSSYDAIDDLNENYDIWNTQTDDDEGILIFESISKQLLENICENSNTLVYVTEEDVTVDCKTYNKGDKSEVVHNIAKREAEEEPEFEGSGGENVENLEKEEDNKNLDIAESDKESEAGENNKQETEVVDGGSTHETHQEVNEEQDVAQEESETENKAELENQETTPKTDTQAVTEEKSAEIPEEVPKTDTQTVAEEKSVEIPEETESKNETINTEEPTDSGFQQTTPETHEEDIVLTTQKISVETTTVPETDEIKDETTQLTEIDSSGDQSTNVKVETTTTLKQEANEETTQKVETSTIKKEDPETKINDLPAPKENQISADDKQPNNEVVKDHDHPEPKSKKPGEGRSVLNAPIKESSDAAANDGTVKTDESTQKAGSKDTTILIVLFAAVVLVGALAFAYNFIKKRKQRSRDLEHVERAPSIKRSLQNLTKLDEPEKKPLIGESKEVEMVNMKRDGTPLKENGESVSNETTVKT